MTTEQEEIINKVAKANSFEYSISKTSEELQELSLLLTQKLNKPLKSFDDAIIDEIGDVLIRLKILEKFYSIEKIEKRISEKLNKLSKYLDKKEYNQV